MNPTDHQLETLFRDSSADLSPDVVDLVAGGIARGRARRRRQGVGAALAAVAVVGVIGVAASVAPGLVDDRDSAPAFVAAPDPVKPKERPDVTTPRQDIDAELAVAATDIPAEVASVVSPGDLPQALEKLGPILQDDTFPLVDTAREKIVHFRWEGTLTTFIIEPASGLGTCQEFAAQGDGACEVVNGLETLTWGPTTADQDTAQGVQVWQHGYAVSAISYNAPDGKDVPPTMADPAISLDDLTALAASEVWFE
jgi:hypothetical protein